VRTFGLVLFAIVTGWAFAVFISALTGTGSFSEPHVIVAMLWIIGPGGWVLQRWANSVKRRSEALKASKSTPPSPAA
jgi:hypothetical protein